MTLTDAGVQPAQDRRTAEYGTTWIPHAVTNANLSIPIGFSKTEAEVLQALVRQEGGRHSYAPQAPHSISSISIGEAVSANGGDHAFTDGGLGFCKVQPYNANGNNLYDPEENLTRGAEILHTNINAAANPGQTAGPNSENDPKIMLWYGIFKYNRGNFAPGFSIFELRSEGGLNAQSAGYADSVFAYLDLDPPQ